jgi:murein DD-endopeptidase MepM/ murein hydrolase activator NlpD
MVGAAVVLAVGAGNRTTGVAWGGLSDSDGPEEFVLPSSGFIVVDMSSVYLSDDGRELSHRSLKTAARQETTAAAAAVPEWSFPERIVVSAGGDGVSGSPFANSGASSLAGFRVRMPDQLPVNGGSYGTSGDSLSNAGVSRLSGFRIPMPENLPVEGFSFGIGGTGIANAGESRLGAFALNAPAQAAAVPESSPFPLGEFLPGKMESDYDSVVLSTASDGKSLPAEEDPELSAEEEDVVLTEVKALWKEHFVKSGETMSDIAVAYGVSMSDILKANELKDANRLAEKQLLLIPDSGEAVEATLEEVLTRKARVLAAREQVVPVKVTAYVVAQGDSLWSIASSQNLEIDTLFGCNDLKNPDRLRPGVTLRIPNQDGIFYTVKKGDVLEKIAKNYGIPVERIRKGNGEGVLKPLQEGKEIFLPGARPEAADPAPAKKSGSSKSGGRSEGKTVSSASRSYRWPVVGRINSPFGWRRHPVTRRRDFHTGIDIKAPRGRAIKAAKAGRIEYAGWMGGYGRVVVVRHNDGYSTLYAHCSSLSVRNGQSVSQGQTIASVGTSGRTTGPHLHFEIRQGKSPMNPLKLLK